ncbi:uncharacterized protein MELLADRAFT_63400 [Melampsora larici-populina 98AG31]|uniref:Secreted protein n=1 Tax=Melampsora larici-populina (strain 98AG31 / pathotype 3-4-7) TaxID=747676 RepID=F4RMI2_MELLP|nr:uncharacterized protein MELLADRAFT_63400 [Melampsora larici-populina 98AG31]EGG06468.1 hypothetical protein MELLADRAFT_63400 [Melampsora larici-populina 98AG31]
MHLSWLFTVLALAAAVYAAVLPNVFTPNQLAARDNVWLKRWYAAPTLTTTITVTEVVAYVQTVVEQFRTCSGQLATITETQAVVQLLTETHTTISQPLLTLGGCDCSGISQNVEFTNIYSQVYVVFQSMVQVITTTWQTELFTGQYLGIISISSSPISIVELIQSFGNADTWSLYSTYFTSLTQTIDTYGIKTVEVIQNARVDISVFAGVGIYTWVTVGRT